MLGFAEFQQTPRTSEFSRLSNFLAAPNVMITYFDVSFEIEGFFDVVVAARKFCDDDCI